MPPRELSDAEVFSAGSPPASDASAPQVELSDSDVFGSQFVAPQGAPWPGEQASPTPKASPVLAPQPQQPLSDEAVFGTPVDPRWGGYPEADTSVTKYVIESAKAAASGLTGFFGAALQGEAPDAGKPQMFPGESDLEYQLRLSEWQQAPKPPVASSPLYKAGKSLQEIPMLQRDPAWRESLLLDVMAGGGSVAGVFGSSILGGPQAAAVAAMSAGRGEAVERAIRAGATEDQIRSAGTLGNVAGATDLADLLLTKMGSVGKAYGLIKRVGAKAIYGAFTEGGQEGVQQFIQNAISRGVYDPTQDLWEGVPYAALVGGIVGGVAGPVLSRSGPEGFGETPTADEIARAGGYQAPPAAPTAPPPPEQPTAPPAVLPGEYAGELGPEPPPIGAPAGGPVEAPTPSPTGIPVEDYGNGWTVQPNPARPDEVNVYKDGKLVGMGTPHRMRDWARRRSQDSAPLDLESPNRKPEAGEMDPTVAKFLTDNKPPIQAKEELRNLPEEIETSDLGRGGFNTKRMLNILGLRLYGEPAHMAEVTIKELFQNSFDAVKGAMAKHGLAGGRIEIEVDPQSRGITFRDNGSGMNPQILADAFFKPAGTHKETEDSSGGFGFAKMLYLFGNQGLSVRTMREGKVYTVNSTGKEIFDWINGEGPSPKVQTRAPNAKDLETFPEGHGTEVMLVLPKDYVEKGVKLAIPIWVSPDLYAGLRNSPLLHPNIAVTYNGQPLENTGATFPHDKYQPLVSMEFDWGTADLIVSREPVEGVYNNVIVLSNGIWQFSDQLRYNPGDWASDIIPHTFYLDVHPKNKPGEGAYPFDLNRQGFTEKEGKDVSEILNHVARMYRFELAKDSSTNFGDIQYLDEEGGIVTASPKVRLVPKKPEETMASPAQMKPGSRVTVHKGRMRLDGKDLKPLKPEDFKLMGIDVGSLMVDQSIVDPTKPMVHDNVVVKISDLEQKGILELGREKFGQQFDILLHDMGRSFMELRNTVVTVMNRAWKAAQSEPENRLGYGASVPHAKNYDALLEEAVGISFDQNYRGVSIRVPFSASFLNLAVPEAKDPVRAGVGLAFTMIHELAHHKARTGPDGHDAEFPAELQRIVYNLYAAEDFDFHGFLQHVVSIVHEHEAIFEWFNHIFSGAYDLSPRGKRLQTGTGERIAPDGSGAVAPARGQRPDDQRGVPSGSQSREAVASDLTGRRELPFTLEERGHVGSGFNVKQRLAANRSSLAAIDPEISVPYPQPEVAAIYDGMMNLFQATGGGGARPPGRGGRSGPSAGGAPPPSVQQMAAHADRMNKLYKWGWGLDRLADRNPRFAPLLRYAERIREMRTDTAKIHDAALRIAKQWRKLGTDAEGLAALIDDVANMRYRTSSEISRNITRHPTQQEFQQLVAQHRVSRAALEVYQKQKLFFEVMVNELTQNAIASAQRTISDPAALVDRVDQINKQKQTLLKKPYFPFVRFGMHFVTVRDAQGNVVSFETYERTGPFAIRSAERTQRKAAEELRRSVPQGYTVEVGVLPETAAPFVGLPPALLDSIATELNLTQAQKDALDQLKYEYSPSASFVHHLRHKSYTKGYSKDFLRAFSRYAFHMGRYYGRTKYSWALRQEIVNARTIGGNKAGAIANYMEDHLQNTVLDAKGDFGHLKGAIFLWVFGYSPAGAAINLSQIPMVSYPWMAAKFGGIVKGDAVASAALVRASLQLKNFYKKGAYDNQTEFEMRAIEYGIKSGRITEAMASELAGLAQGENLLGFGNTKLGRGFQLFLEKAAFLFEMSEQFNRRVTYRAALDLAKRYPNSLATREALNKYADEYQNLLGSGWSAEEAKAVITAVHAVEQTQFVYARETRPRFMRGRVAGTIFVFKTYMINVLQLLGANKASVMPRYMLMMALMGGLMGLPGAEDIDDILAALGKWMFGKDFNLKLALRELILDLGEEKIPPDLILHGLSRRGFGLPALVDMMGEAPGRGLQPGPAQNVPFPVVDMSKSLGMGRILPFEVGKLLNPGRDPATGIASTAQQASGAVFSVGFNLYKALTDSQTPWGDIKRWEKAMPRAMASASRAYRAYSEGRERGRGGPAGASTIVPYEVRDTEQMAEILAMAMGFMPLRQSAKWDAIIAQVEVTNKFKAEKEILLRQFFEAQMGKDQEEISRVIGAIREFNGGLPNWARGLKITSDSARSSLEQRMRIKTLREAGIPSAKGEVPIARHIQSLFPESVVDVRRVK